jgi:hypothetical protein
LIEKAGYVPVPGFLVISNSLLVIRYWLLLPRQLKTAIFDRHPVIPAKAEIQYYQPFYWIPALRFAAAGMTK